MDAAEIWQLLNRGGLRVDSDPGHDPLAGEATGPPRITKYNGLLDPGGAERLGELLAGLARSAGSDVVVVWEDVEDAVLGFVVGRALGLPVIRVENADGLVESSEAFPQGARGVLVGDAFPDVRTVAAVHALLGQHGGELAAVVSLVGLPEPRLPVQAQSLVSVESGGRSTA